MTLDEAMPAVCCSPRAIERRGSPRVAVTAPVSIACEGSAAPLMGPSLDIGLGGLCVQLDEQVDLDSIRRVSIRVDRTDVEFVGTGVWQRRAKGNGRVIVGVEFVQVQPRDSWVLWGLLSTRVLGLARFLVECSEFEGLTIDAAMDIAMRTRRRQFDPGSTVYRRGRIEPEGHSIFVIMAGRVDLIREAEDGRSLALGRACQGAVIGGLPLVMDMDHADSGLCLDSVELLEIDEFAYEILTKEKPVVARVLARSVVRRSLEQLGAFADSALADLPPTDAANDEKPR